MVSANSGLFLHLPPLCTPAQFEKCKPACAAAADTPVAMGAIHPRTKKPVEVASVLQRVPVYEGDKAYTGPTLSGCRLDGGTLTISFNSSLLKGEKSFCRSTAKAPLKPMESLSLAEVTSTFRQMQTTLHGAAKTPAGELYCPTWAGGTGKPINSSNTNSTVAGRLGLTSLYQPMVDRSWLTSAHSMAVLQRQYAMRGTSSIVAT